MRGSLFLHLWKGEVSRPQGWSSWVSLWDLSCSILVTWLLYFLTQSALADFYFILRSDVQAKWYDRIINPVIRYNWSVCMMIYVYSVQYQSSQKIATKDCFILPGLHNSHPTTDDSHQRNIRVSPDARSPGGLEQLVHPHSPFPCFVMSWKWKARCDPPSVGGTGWFGSPTPVM